MLEHVDEFRSHCRDVGVGSRDKVADSITSYVSYLERASRIASEAINPATLRREQDLTRIASKLTRAGVNRRSVNNIKSAMRRYVGMVERYGL